MADKQIGEINLTHAISPNLDIKLTHTTDDYSKLKLDCKIDKNTDVEVSTDSNNKTNVSLNIKI